MSSKFKNLGTVMGSLIDSGIQVALITALPKSINVHIGTEERGPVAMRSFNPGEFELIYPWLIEKGAEYFPQSRFAAIEWLDS